MKRGFTLVELLGVIVILSVIMAFTFPVIIDTIKDKNEDADSYKMEMIENAARLYIRDNGLSGNRCISIDTLKNTKYLNDIDIDATYVKVTYENNEVTYELTGECS